MHFAFFPSPDLTHRLIGIVAAGSGRVLGRLCRFLRCGDPVGRFAVRCGPTRLLRVCCSSPDFHRDVGRGERWGAGRSSVCWTESCRLSHVMINVGRWRKLLTVVMLVSLYLAAAAGVCGDGEVGCLLAFSFSRGRPLGRMGWRFSKNKNND